MTNKKTLIIFPLLTQCIFSLFLLFFDAFNLDNLSYVFLLTTIPAFLFSLVCIGYQYHQRNLVQIAFFSGVISFFYTLVTLSFLIAHAPLQEAQALSLWEQSLAMLFYAAMFALPSMMYAMIVLRLFLKKSP
ncbi:hypothetical protein [Pasteurella oralis]|uniref:hypothetical protein n=1 Tax=Pasteurella oralis TaxID=1071947 RepID=UPI000C7D6818|nr:hypothetical protein [Pasteurella oralis]